MELKIIKIDGEFVIVKLKNGKQKICPSEIFPGVYEIGNEFCVTKKCGLNKIE